MTGDDPYGAVVTWLRRPGGPGPLAGVRVGVKDLIAVAGAPRLCGAPGIADPSPQPRDAACVARLVAAGAALVATTATHQFAYGIVTPQTRNPRAPDRIAGGSSGGSAAALAAGLVDGALGTDTGGSVRIPAACCGVVGLKPTYGRIPVDGVQPLAPSLDTVGPLARDVATTARLFAVLLDAPVVPRLPSPLRVGVPAQLTDSRVDEDVRSVWHAVLDDLAAAGAVVATVDLPTLPRAPTANGRILAAEALAVHGDAYTADPAGFAADVGARLAAAHDLDPAAVDAARVTAARLGDELRAAFARVDVLVVPTLPCRVPPVGVDPIVVDGVEEAVVRAMTRGTNAWNLTGVPAGSVPAGHDGGGAPVGVQVVGAPDAEATVLGVMGLVERLRGGPQPPIADAGQSAGTPSTTAK